MPLLRFCCRRTRPRSLNGCVIALLTLLALLTSYLSFVLCDFMRVTEAQPDPDTYNEPIKVGLFCHADADDNSLDTDTVLWQAAKILGITSLMLGLIDTLTVCTVLILPHVCLKTAKSADLTWHCMSAFSCIAAILEVWALLPYASDVCDGANVCETGSGTWLLGFSFLFYFVSAVLVELTVPPADHLKNNATDANDNSNPQGGRGPPVQYELGQGPPRNGSDLPGFDIYSQSGYSNVSSITGASAFQMAIEVRLSMHYKLGKA